MSWTDGPGAPGRAPVDVLVVAEPFGFGPAAAAVQLAQAITAAGRTCGFAGRGHTLPLARTCAAFSWVVDLDHDAPPDPAGTGGPGLRAVAAHARAALVCMDLPAARELTDLAMPVLLYDALAWFWPGRPTAVTAGATWLCQDFFTVTDAVAAARAAGARAFVVPPLATPATNPAAPTGAFARNGVVLNLGGLLNPLIDTDLLLTYAERVAGAAHRACRGTGRPAPQVLAAAEVAAHLTRRGFAASSLDPAAAARACAGAEVVFATPGLGHLYEASAGGWAACWVPGANDSQVMQADLLRGADMLDAGITWADLGHGTLPEAGQGARSAWVADRLRVLGTDPGTQSRLVDALAAAAAHLTSTGPDKIRALVHRFPPAGPVGAAAHVLRALDDLDRAAPAAARTRATA